MAKFGSQSAPGYVIEMHYGTHFRALGVAPAIHSTWNEVHSGLHRFPSLHVIYLKRVHASAIKNDTAGM